VDDGLGPFRLLAVASAPAESATLRTPWPERGRRDTRSHRAAGTISAVSGRALLHSYPCLQSRGPQHAISAGAASARHRCVSLSLRNGALLHTGQVSPRRKRPMIELRVLLGICRRRSPGPVFAGVADKIEELHLPARPSGPSITRSPLKSLCWLRSVQNPHRSSLQGLKVMMVRKCPFLLVGMVNFNVLANDMARHRQVRTHNCAKE
jgi:hypothetical protein